MDNKDKKQFSEKRRSKRVSAPKEATALFKNDIGGLDRIHIRDLSLNGLLICDNYKGERYFKDAAINNLCLNIYQINPLKELNQGVYAIIIKGIDEEINPIDTLITRPIFYNFQLSTKDYIFPVYYKKMYTSAIGKYLSVDCDENQASMRWDTDIYFPISFKLEHKKEESTNEMFTKIRKFQEYLNRLHQVEYSLSITDYFDIVNENSLRKNELNNDEIDLHIYQNLYLFSDIKEGESIINSLISNSKCNEYFVFFKRSENDNDFDVNEFLIKISEYSKQYNLNIKADLCQYPEINLSPTDFKNIAIEKGYFE